MMVRAQERPSPEEIFDDLRLFNHLVVLAEELASRLPERAFARSFNGQGDIYVDGKFLGVNVKQRYEALTLK
jgi:hypothetical protein